MGIFDHGLFRFSDGGIPKVFLVDEMRMKSQRWRRKSPIAWCSLWWKIMVLGMHLMLPSCLWNIANWKTPKINGAFVRWENHLFLWAICHSYGINSPCEWWSFGWWLLILVGWWNAPWIPGWSSGIGQSPCWFMRCWLWNMPKMDGERYSK